MFFLLPPCKREMGAEGREGGERESEGGTKGGEREKAREGRRGRRESEGGIQGGERERVREGRRGRERETDTQRQREI